MRRRLRRIGLLALAVGGLAASAQQPGEELFQSYCAACHQYDGQNVGEAPPLDGTDWVTGPETRLILIALHGVSGRMEIHGQVFDREMPGFGEILGNGDLAVLLSYVRRRFGEPSEPIAAETVEAVRTAHKDRDRYWKVDELLRIGASSEPRP